MFNEIIGLTSHHSQLKKKTNEIKLYFSSIILGSSPEKAYWTLDISFIEKIIISTHGDGTYSSCIKNLTSLKTAYLLENI